MQFRLLITFVVFLKIFNIIHNAFGIHYSFRRKNVSSKLTGFDVQNSDMSKSRRLAGAPLARSKDAPALVHLCRSPARCSSHPSRNWPRYNSVHIINIRQTKWFGCRNNKYSSCQQHMFDFELVMQGSGFPFLGRFIR